MKLFRFSITALLLTMMTTGAFAQLRLGAGVGFGFDNEAFTVFARGAYDFNEVIRLNLTYNYYFLEEVEGLGSDFDSNLSDINLDLHYTFAQLETISFYGLAGANVAIANVKAPGIDESETDFGLNLGIGGLFGVGDNADIFSEFKYTLGSTDQIFFNLGLLFSLGAGGSN